MLGKIIEDFFIVQVSAPVEVYDEGFCVGFPGNAWPANARFFVLRFIHCVTDEKSPIDLTPEFMRS